VKKVYLLLYFAYFLTFSSLIHQIIQIILEDTFIATTIPEEDENCSTASPQTESAHTDIVKQYDEYLRASLVHKDRVMSVHSTSNTVVTSCKGIVFRL
jgi:hypothetical protein